MKKIIFAIAAAITLCGCGHNIVTYGEGFGVRIFSAVVKDNASAELACSDGELPLTVKIAVGDQTTGYEVESTIDSGNRPAPAL